MASGLCSTLTAVGLWCLAAVVCSPPQACAAVAAPVCAFLPASPSGASPLAPPRRKKGQAPLLDEVTVSAPAKPKPPKVAGLVDVQKCADGWHLFVRDSLLGKPLLCLTRFVATPADCGVYGGEVASNGLVYLQRQGQQLLLRLVAHTNEAPDTANVARAVRASAEDPIVASLKITARVDSAATSEVCLADLPLTNDLLFGLSQARRDKLGLSDARSNLSFVDTVRTYQRNLSLTTVKTYGAKSTSPGRSAKSAALMTFRLTTTLLALPERPFRPRAFDRRVGYFTTDALHFDDRQREVDRRLYATRWRLEPKNAADAARQANGQPIEPRRPITFHIDPAWPDYLKPYVRAAVDDWQEAFRLAGWSNAIVCRDALADSIVDMEDARYNMIRYLASPTKNAYGPMLTDPRTGEILGTNVCVYHNVTALVHDWYTIQAGCIDSAARQRVLPEALTGRLMRYVVCHEVGHTLGLRHNMGASACTPVDSLRNARYLRRHGHTASIMDYCRLNYAAQPSDGIPPELLVPGVGDYDRWAIRWGYGTPLSAAETSAALDRNRRLWFGGEGNDGDPRALTEDLGDDPLRADELGIRNLKRMANELPLWAYEEGDDYRNLRGLLDALVSQLTRYVSHATLRLGGLRHDYKSVDQAGPIYAPSPARETAQAIDFLSRHALGRPDWLLEQPYLDRLTGAPQRLFESVAEKAVKGLCSTTVLTRLSQMADMPATPTQAPMPPAEYVRRATDALYAPVRAGRPLDAWQRYVTRLATQTLVAAYQAVKVGDARSWLMMALRLARKALKAAPAQDEPTKAHIADLVREIDNAVDAHPNS